MRSFLLLFIQVLYFIHSQNITKAIEYLEKHANPSSTGQCGSYVGDALIEAGFKIRKTNRHGYLYYYDNLLINAGFKVIGNEINIPKFLPGDIMVNLNTTNHPYGHVCMYNGTKWISDFVQNTIYTYKDDLNCPTYFFRYEQKMGKSTEKCQCYKDTLNDINYPDDECIEMILEFLSKEICPLIPGVDGTEEEIDKCELEYFCGNTNNGAKKNDINLKAFTLLTFILIML